MESLLVITILSCIFQSTKLESVVLTANAFTQRGQEIQLNCSSNVVPIGQTAEFLVNNMTFTNIRKHKLVCFNTKLREACNNVTCRCAENKKSYMAIFKPPYNSKYINLMCRMKFSGGRVILSQEVVATILDMSSPNIQVNESLPLISGTSVNLICSAPKTNSSFYIVWKCGHVTYQKGTMYNLTFAWSTLELKIDATYNGIQCICSLHAREVDFAVSDFIILTVENKPILTLNNEFYCNSSGTVALVCSVRGGLGEFGFAQWTHSVGGKYIRSLPGTTDEYISLLIINECSFKDGGEYVCAVWNKDGDSVLWENLTTTLTFADESDNPLLGCCPSIGPPIILSKMVEEIDFGQKIKVTFFTSSSLVSVNWQCNGKPLNGSITGSNLEETPTDIEIYSKQISLSVYKTYLSTHNKQCFNDNYDICLSNDYAVLCEQILFTKGGKGFSIFWIMLFIVPSVIAVVIVLTLVGVMKKHFKGASHTIQLEDVGHSSNDERYLQIYEPDQIATHQYDTTGMPCNDLVPNRATRDYDTAVMSYNELVPYQSNRCYNVTSPEYLEVQPDIDTYSIQSDRYEKVD